MQTQLAFEKPLVALEERLRDLKQLAGQGDVKLLNTIQQLEAETEATLKRVYRKLTPWQVVSVARHSARPHTRDYIAHLIEGFEPLAGDRMFADDAAILGGLGRFCGRAVLVMGHEKGKDTDDRVRCNFGMPRPEGYRKVRRLMQLAGRFGLPVVAFVDTPGAHPGADAEERNQSEALAACIQESLDLEVPVVSTIIGEGGSGGAVAMASADVVLMNQYAVYSVISPEGCASILWRTRERAEDAASALKLTAPELLALKIVDHVIPEPPGGAHRNPRQVMDAVGSTIEKALLPLLKKSPERLLAERQERFLRLGSALT